MLHCTNKLIPVSGYCPLAGRAPSGDHCDCGFHVWIWRGRALSKVTVHVGSLAYDFWGS